MFFTNILSVFLTFGALIIVSFHFYIIYIEKLLPLPPVILPISPSYFMPMMLCPAALPHGMGWILILAEVIISSATGRM